MRSMYTSSKVINSTHLIPIKQKTLVTLGIGYGIEFEFTMNLYNQSNDDSFDFNSTCRAREFVMYFNLISDSFF